MKLSNSLIKEFEQHQEKHGTRGALEMFLWQLGADLMRMAGVKNIKTTYLPKK